MEGKKKDMRETEREKQKTGQSVCTVYPATDEKIKVKKETNLFGCH